ncbi:hypothetical protein KDN34_02905 [Shewanella yunxiaonensis]|uniref:Phage protein n=1 Tax=Shewanella yunxiaonensis TaxID=2829809 RepID=A0ABX7YUJ2_9GAMM|nr:hypothetical protein [Shewanella yunxiaonensis]QUN06429.1 hypothetical protein KDN34_02905 [Shewanella yunxiaonensis]
MRELYSRAPELSESEQRELDAEIAGFGIVGQEEEEPEPPIVFWDEHKAAIEWWLQVQDMLRWQGPICEGLDISAVKADAEMAERQFIAEDYRRLRLIANTVKSLFNDRLKR